MQSAGSFLGTLMGSGVLLIVYNYLGWNCLLWTLALCVIFAIIPLSLYRLKNEKTEEKIGFAKSHFVFRIHLFFPAKRHRFFISSSWPFFYSGNNWEY